MPSTPRSQPPKHVPRLDRVAKPPEARRLKQGRRPCLSPPLSSRRAERPSPGPARIVLAVKPDVEEDRAPRHRGEDDCCRARHPDGHSAEPDVDGEPERPEKGRDAMGDRRGHRGGNTVSATKNSPSRLRFRPPNLLAFRLRVQPPGSASTYSRSVLGASGTVDPVADRCKGACHENDAICAQSR